LVFILIEVPKPFWGCFKGRVHAPICEGPLGQQKNLDRAACLSYAAGS